MELMLENMTAFYFMFALFDMLVMIIAGVFGIIQDILILKIIGVFGVILFLCYVIAFTMGFIGLYRMRHKK